MTIVLGAFIALLMGRVAGRSDDIPKWFLWLAIYMTGFFATAIQVALDAK